MEWSGKSARKGNDNEIPLIDVRDIRNRNLRIFFASFTASQGGGRSVGRLVNGKTNEMMKE